MVKTRGFIAKYKKWIIILFIAVVACFFLFGSPKGWDRAEKYLDKFEVIEKEIQKKIIDSLKNDRELFKTYKDSVEGVVTIFIPNQNNEINRLKNENKALHKELDFIRFAQYTQRRLDSFAEHAKHK